jgi:cell division protein FtsB
MRLKKGTPAAVNKGMRAAKYGMVLWIFVVVYAAMNFFAGSRGFFAYGDLLEEQKKQETNLRDLQRINEELENTKNALLYDDDTVRVYARDLGFGEEGEQFVRIVGLGQNRKVPLFPGEVVVTKERRPMNSRTIGLISLFAALAVLIAFVVQDMLDLNLDERAPRLDPAGIVKQRPQSFRRVPRPLPPEPLGVKREKSGE